MSVSEHGEIGVFVEPDIPEDSTTPTMIIHWMIRARKIANEDFDPFWKKGDLLYCTSAGWRKGLADSSDCFMPTERERSLRPCIRRAIDYAMKKWPRIRNETH